MNKKLLLCIAVISLSSACVSYAAQAPSVVVNGTKVNAEAKIIDDRIYLPVRAVGEALSADVSWDGQTATANVTTAQAEAGANEIENIVSRAAGSVVGIVVTTDEGNKLTGLYHGSGFFVSNSGEIVTNAHVIADALKILVITTDGNNYDAQVIGSDEKADIALLKIEKENTPYLTLASTEEIRVGQTAVSIGTPLSVSYRGTAANGIISGKDRMFGDFYYRVLQTNAAANGGNSGGPLVLAGGKVAGMVTMGYTDAQGMNFCISSDTIQYALDQFRTYGEIRRPALGITTQDSYLGAFDLPHNDGVTVLGVGEALAGKNIQRNDSLLAIDGQKVTYGIDIHELLKQYLPGDSVTLTLRRDGTEFTVNLVLAEDESGRD